MLCGSTCHDPNHQGLGTFAPSKLQRPTYSNTVHHRRLDCYFSTNCIAFSFLILTPSSSSTSLTSDYGQRLDGVRDEEYQYYDGSDDDDDDDGDGDGGDVDDDGDDDGGDDDGDAEVMMMLMI